MTTIQSPQSPDSAIRNLAITRLRKRREYAAHLLAYVLVNAFIVVIWALTSTGGFFWPVFPMAIWGIGLVLTGWDVWLGDEFSEVAITREIERLQQPR
jgi:predicted tellurium resistance membrane protein TerC